MSLLLRFVTPPVAAPADPLAFFAESPRRRSSAAALGGAAALVLAPLLAPPAASFPDPARQVHERAASGAGAVLAPNATRELAPSAYLPSSRRGASAQSFAGAFVSDAVAPAAAFDLVTVVFPDAWRRSRGAGSIAIASPLDVTRDAPPPVFGQERSRARSVSWTQPLLPDLARDAPPPVQGQERSRTRSDSRSQPLLPDLARDAPPPVQGQERARARSSSWSQPLLPDLTRSAPPPVLGQERSRARSESRSQPHILNALVPAVLPVLVDTAGENEHHRQRQYDQATETAPPLLAAVQRAPAPVLAETLRRAEQGDHSRAAPLLPDALVPAVLPVLVDTAGENEHHRQRQYDQSSETALLLDQLQGLPPSAERPDPRASAALPAGSIADAPALHAPAPEPDIFRGGAPKKRRQWIDLEASARTGRVVLTIEELLEPEPIPTPPDHPLLGEVLSSAEPIGIHDTPELAALRAKLAAEEARSKELEASGSKHERSARRWRFATVGLATLYALVRSRRR